MMRRSYGIQTANEGPDVGDEAALWGRHTSKLSSFSPRAAGIFMYITRPDILLANQELLGYLAVGLLGLVCVVAGKGA